jgi:dolichol-phosphate mannosyltransferase
LKESLVIIPTYNEAENIQDILRAVMDLPEQFDVMVVDDGSPDGTQDLVEEMQQTFPNRIFLEKRNKKAGLGTAYLHAFDKGLELGYELLYEMDADFSHNPNDLRKLRQACIDGADVAVGSRYSEGVNVVNWPISRVLLSYFASVYVRIITGMPIHDATAGFKCYRRRVLETINLKKIRFVGYAFQIEMKYKSWLEGFNVVEVPIIFTDRTRGESKMSKAIVREAFFGVISMRLHRKKRKKLPVSA